MQGRNPFRRGISRRIAAGAGLALISTAMLAATASTATASGTTLNIWLNNGDDITKILGPFDRQFERMHPGLTIKVKLFSLAELQAKSRLALLSNHPPDIIQATVQIPILEELVRAHAFLSLQKYADQYGWVKRMGNSVWFNLNMRFDPKTGEVGKGDIYGMQQVIAPLGVYYNKLALKKLGLSVPGNFTQFAQDLAKAKQAGVQPLTAGNSEKWPFLHVWYLTLDQLASRPALNNIMAHCTSAGWNTPAVLQSVQLMQNWAKQGYFPTNMSSLGYDDSIRQFAQGNGLFYITGSWASSSFYSAGKNNVGFFAMPPLPGHPLLTTDGPNWQSFVSSKTKNPDLAAEWINYMSSAKAETALAAAGSIPMMKLPKLPAVNPLFQSVIRVGSTFPAKQAEVNYMDSSTPSMLNTMEASMDDLLAGRSTPAQFVAALQKDQEANPHGGFGVCS
jgi:raffinose/stachyose/melibiose transport system substrate-binding protein